MTKVIRHRHIRLLQSLNQLLFAQSTIFVSVQGNEHRSKLFQIAVLQILGNHGEHHLLQSRGKPEFSHICSDVLVEFDQAVCCCERVHQPRMAEQVLGGGSLGRIEGQHLRDEVLQLAGVLVPIWAWEVEASPLHSVEDIEISVAVEGRIAADQDVADDTTAPDVALLIVSLAGQDLGRDVVWSPSLGLHELSRRVGLCKAEIDDLDLGFSGPVLEEEILRFDIPVSVGLGVQVAHSSQNLLHISRYILLTEGAAFMLVRFFHDSVEKLAAGAKLHDQVDSPGVNECLVELHDVRMV
mmetsp:Transcript_91352/g.200133  ORF Transcript_91352/g.200133 Transcript_91352/m.200133 type:complete len:297 (-) Transcript_91352:306-1196(-)